MSPSRDRFYYYAETVGADLRLKWSGEHRVRVGSTTLEMRRAERPRDDRGHRRFAINCDDG